MVTTLQLPAQGNDPLPEDGLVITVGLGVPIPAGQTISAISATNGGIVLPGQAATPIGVSGEADAGIGVQGVSNASIGVRGQSSGFDAIVGETQSDAHAGITGRNLTSGANGGVGVYGVGGEFAGKFDGNVQINGALSINGNAAHTVLGNLSVSEEVNASILLSKGDTIVGGLLTVNGRTGTSTIVGTLSVRGDVVLTNQDCAEDFDLAPLAEFEPGTVMVLDDCGLLQASSLPYDRKVAGVISGAGEFKPGLILGRNGTHENAQRAPIALVGKVFCKVDARNAAIAVGDLLTTSVTKGHAMRAEHPIRAFGAVIGKALQHMPLGLKGFIPILIALQ